MVTKTLWSLPAQPLPSIELPRPAFVTIWFFTTFGFCILFERLLRSPSSNPRKGFKTINTGTLLLTLWYFFTLIDRWLHYDRRNAPFGYIIAVAVWEFSRVSSAILLLWGTYKVVWEELEISFGTSTVYWWIGAQCIIFLVGLISLFYVVLKLALAIVWIKFFNLNIIADIATKKKHFELATAVFVTTFALFTVIAASASLVNQARKITGRVFKSRLFLLFGTIFLFCRSAVEISTAAIDQAEKTNLASDISYGLGTSLFLIMMYFMAWVSSSSTDTASKHAVAIQGCIRRHIADKLRNETNDARTEAPPLLKVIQHTRDNDLTKILVAAAHTISIDPDHKRGEATRTAHTYLAKLEAEFGQLDPKKGKNFHLRSQRPSTRPFSWGPGRPNPGDVPKQPDRGEGLRADNLHVNKDRRRSGQNLRSGGGTRPVISEPAAESLLEHAEGQEDSFVVQPSYPRPPGVRSSTRRVVTDPSPWPSYSANNGPSIAPSHASSPVPSVAAPSWIHEIGENSPRAPPAVPVVPPRPLRSPPQSQPMPSSRNHMGPNVPLNRHRSQPTFGPPPTLATVPQDEQEIHQPAEQQHNQQPAPQVEMRFGRGIPNRITPARYKDAMIEMQNRQSSR